ncbi:MAG: hypothetical protein ACLQLG_14120 [Thermoguttaceae bacterium]
MARSYAGILGPLAFLTVLARGLLGGGGTEPVLYQAWLSLLAFAALGCVIGWFAERTVRDSVNGRIAAELAQQKPA